MSRLSAVRFRGKVYAADMHAEALEDCIEDPAWPEPQSEIENIIDDGLEPFEFGYVRAGIFRPLEGDDERIRREYLLSDYWPQRF